MALLFVISLPVPSGAAPPPPPGPRTGSRGAVEFSATLTTHLQPDGRIIGELLIEVPYRSLRFVREGTDWLARFDITAIVLEGGNRQVNGDLWTVPLRTDDAIRDQLAGRVWRRRLPLLIEPGRLRFEVRISQSGSGREGTWEGEIDVPRYEAQPLSFNRPLFGRCDLDSTTLDTTWARGGLFPSVRRRYGDRQPELCVEGELYDHVAGSDSAAYALGWSILGPGDRAAGSGAVRVPRNKGRGHFRITPDIADLAHGDYRLRLEVRLGDVGARIEEPFQVDESRLRVSQDPDMIRGVLSYVATNDELVTLEKARPESLESVWNRFWIRRDPTPDTPVNENLAEFMRRIEYVNGEFAGLDPGWKTDMGRIYIRYGAPDEIEKVPFNANGPPHVIWYYRARSLRFVFVDEEGFGRYRLVGSPRQ